MKCPDCKKYSEMELVEYNTGKDGEEYQCLPYYKCPVCKLEIEDEE